jgi:hydroxymethylglutaryl-CoA lyase
MNFPKSVHISEEGPREGFQIEKTLIPTERKVELIDALSETGLKQIQIAAFVNPKQVPGMADSDEVVRQINVKPGVSYGGIWFNQKGLERARSTNRLTLLGKIRMFPSDAFLAANLKRTAEEHLKIVHQEMDEFKAQMIPVDRISITSAFGCNFQGDIKPERVMSDIAQAVEIAKEHDIKPTIISLADTMAWATPLAVKRLVGQIQDKYPQYKISLHLHDTRGMAVANAYAGLELGVDMFDASVAGLGGCPFAAHAGAAGNLCTEDFVFMCDELGIETGVDLEKLINVATLAEEIVGHPLPGSVMRGGSLKKLREKA